MKQRRATIILSLLALHIVIAVTFIFDPSLLPPSRLERFYRVYLLPGPFFTESRIVDSQSLYLSWKVKDKWQPPINPTRENSNLYRARVNPAHLYRSRLEHTLYQIWQEPHALLEKERVKEIEQLRQYLSETYVPKEADSLRIVVIKSRAQNFGIKKDSIQVIFPR